uniref:Uncharacterized protein n=1 Tax=Arundo donax TaxID=35708 RepID=A0A0A9AHS6_ARUDO
MITGKFRVLDQCQEATKIHCLISHHQLTSHHPLAPGFFLKAVEQHLWARVHFWALVAHHPVHQFLHQLKLW